MDADGGAGEDDGWDDGDAGEEDVGDADGEEIGDAGVDADEDDVEDADGEEVGDAGEDDAVADADGEEDGDADEDYDVADADGEEVGDADEDYDVADVDGEEVGDADEDYDVADADEEDVAAAGEDESEGDETLLDVPPDEIIALSDIPDDRARFGRLRYGWEMVPVRTPEKDTSSHVARQSERAAPQPDSRSDDQIARLGEEDVLASDEVAGGEDDVADAGEDDGEEDGDEDVAAAEEDVADAGGDDDADGVADAGEEDGDEDIAAAEEDVADAGEDDGEEDVAAAGEDESGGDETLFDVPPEERIAITEIPDERTRFGEMRYGWELSRTGDAEEDSEEDAEETVSDEADRQIGGAPLQPDSQTDVQLAQMSGNNVSASRGGAKGIQLAQVTEGPSAEKDSILKRPQPQHQPQGISLDLVLPPKGWDLGIVPESWRESMATFTLMPALDVERIWDHNLFRVEHDVKSDRITILTPSLDLRSEWVRHAVSLHGEITWGIHDRNDDENYTDFRLQSDGTLDILGDMKSTLTLSHLRGHEQRGSPDDPGVAANAPIFFETFARLNTEYNDEALLVRNNLEAKRVNFRSSGETRNDDRDRITYTGILRLGYHFYPGTTAFIEPQINSRNYLENVDDDGFRRDGAGWNILAGATYDISGVSFMELGLGYLKQWYDDDELNTVQGLSFSGKLIWNVTDLVTLTGDLGRAVRETTVVDTSGILESSGNFRVDYGFLDDFLVKFTTGYKIEDYEGIDREDKTLTVGTGLRYMLGHNLVADATYDYTHRKANNIEDSNYTDNLFSIRIRLQQ